MDRDAVEVVQGKKAREKRKETRRREAIHLSTNPRRQLALNEKQDLARKSGADRIPRARMCGVEMADACHGPDMRPHDLNVDHPASAVPLAGWTRQSGTTATYQHAHMCLHGLQEIEADSAMMQFKRDSPMRALPFCARRSCRVWSEGEEASGDSCSGE
jgi:hypothetical protein